MVSAVWAPGIEVLAHGRKHHAEKPAGTACNAGVVKAAVEFLAFDGAFGTGAAVGVEVPEGGAARQGSEEAIVVWG